MLACPLLLVTLLALASAWSPFHSEHLKYATQSSISPQYKTPFSPLYAHCLGGFHWQCNYSPIGILCGCLPDASLSKNKGFEEQSSTSLEIFAEVQPGNEDTMVSLYELQCEDEEFVGCVSTGGAFGCGCHDKTGGGDVDFDSDEGFDVLADFGVRAQVGERTVFSFSKVHTPRCTKPGMHLMCCQIGRAHV